jgi:hypothetical protein
MTKTVSFIMKKIRTYTGVILKKYRRYLIFLTGLTIFVLSCISPFIPDYNGKDNSLVVDGSLIKGLKSQVINISRTSSISRSWYESPKYQPVEDCNVRIENDLGNVILFKEESAGRYVANTDDASLSYDRQYKLVFSLPSGENYESSFQSLLRTAPVDSIYGIKESRYSPEFNKDDSQGLQFYVDLAAPDDASKYYRWQIEETWEIHASSKIAGFYDGKRVRLFDLDSPSDTLYYCWKTIIADGIYTASTVNLSENVIKKIPLHYRTGFSYAFLFKYCATVRQFALSKDAYDYWHQKEIELRESGQIYTTQPFQVKSNIFNTANPEERVLGYFWVSSSTLKRVFMVNPFVNTLGPMNRCDTVGPACTSASNPDMIGFLNSYIKARINAHDFPTTFPIFFKRYFTMQYVCFMFSRDECLDCRQRGGNTQKPDFWQ